MTQPIPFQAPHLRLVTPPTDEGKIPPHDLNAEAAVLSAVMLEPGVVAVLEPFLKPEHFYSEAHRQIFAASLAVALAGGVPDIVTVATRLRADERIDQVGGLGYLKEILDAAPAVRPERVTEYGIIVHEYWRLRTVAATTREVCARVYCDDVKPEAVQSFCDDATRRIEIIARTAPVNRIETNIETLRRITKGLVTAHQRGAGAITGLPTQIDAYDALTGGLHAADKTTIVARPGVGKTALALQIALAVAASGVGVLMFQGDMTREQVLVRALTHIGRVDGECMKSGKLSQSDWTKLTNASSVIAQLPLMIDDTTELNIDQVRARALASVDAMRRRYNAPLGLIILDYVQKLAPTPRSRTREKNYQVSEATEGFKALLKNDLKIPGIELAQQRTVTKKTDRNNRRLADPIPSLEDIAESSQISKSADVVLFLHRTNGPREVAMVFRKQRTGRTDMMIDCNFAAEHSRFEAGDKAYPIEGDS